jgi:hypothetical protein
MRNLLLFAICAGAMFFLMVSPSRAETISIASSVPYAASSGISKKQKTDCTLDVRLPKHIESAARSEIEIVILENAVDAVQGKALQLEFVHVFAQPGKWISGSAAVAVRGQLKENDEVIGSVTAFRTTSRPDIAGKIDGLEGACLMLNRCIEVIGQDIVTWLEHPTMNAKLGDAK